MTIVKHELRQSRLSFWIWTGVSVIILAAGLIIVIKKKV